jgi:hypothetical protein
MTLTYTPTPARRSYGKYAVNVASGLAVPGRNHEHRRGVPARPGPGSEPAVAEPGRD